MRSRLVQLLLLATIACSFQNGCTSTNGNPSDSAHKVTDNPHVTEPDAHEVREIETSLTTSETSFATNQLIDAANFGLVGDGVTDNTAVFEQIFSVGYRKVVVHAGDYVTGKLEIPSYTILTLEPGVIIRDSGKLGEHERFINIQGSHVRIEGLGAKIVANRSHYTTGEQRHGVFIFGADHVTIEGLESADHGGDGFYIGGPIGHPATDITLKGCRADNNRRQGLSITSARRIRIVDCEFANTNGTAPQFGVDLEPSHPSGFLDDIVFLRPYTAGNNGGGMLICLKHLDYTSHPVTIKIVEHTSVAELPRLETIVPEEVQPTLRYSSRK